MGSNTTHITTHRHRRAIAAICLAGSLALAACAGGDAADSAASEPLATSDGGAAEDSGGFVASDESRASDTVDDVVVVGDADNGGFDIGVIGRDVIIEMRVVLSSDNIRRSVASIMASASSLGGGVASSDVSYGSGDRTDDQGFAVLVVKIPPQSVDRLLAGLDDTGQVQSINQSAQDVTDQLVNLDVRIVNARQSVANVREFMDRTENLNELVTLEAELTRRQTELEQLEAQERNLSDRVALSTVTIEVVPTASVPEPPIDEDESIGDAFRSGWVAFTAFLFTIGFVLATALPFLALAFVVLGAWLWFRRGGRGRKVDAPATRADDLDPPGEIVTDDERASQREPEPSR